MPSPIVHSTVIFFTRFQMLPAINYKVQIFFQQTIKPANTIQTHTNVYMYLQACVPSVCSFCPLVAYMIIFVIKHWWYVRTGGKATGDESAQKQTHMHRQPLGIKPKASDLSCQHSDH